MLPILSYKLLCQNKEVIHAWDEPGEHSFYISNTVTASIVMIGGGQLVYYDGSFPNYPNYAQFGGSGMALECKVTLLKGSYEVAVGTTAGFYTNLTTTPDTSNTNTILKKDGVSLIEVYGSKGGNSTDNYIVYSDELKGNIINSQEYAGDMPIFLSLEKYQGQEAPRVPGHNPPIIDYEYGLGPSFQFSPSLDKYDATAGYFSIKY